MKKRVEMCGGKKRDIDLRRKRARRLKKGNKWEERLLLPVSCSLKRSHINKPGAVQVFRGYISGETETGHCVITAH